jgi:hypothetical protein
MRSELAHAEPNFLTLVTARVRLTFTLLESDEPVEDIV